MADMIELKTNRLLLKQWRESDYLEFSALNSEPEVMEYFPSMMSKTKSDEMANKIKSLISSRGWGVLGVRKKEKS